MAAHRRIAHRPGGVNADHSDGRGAGPLCYDAAMFIDAHVHLRHGDAARTQYTADEIVEVMDRLAIDRSVVFAICCTTRQSVTMAEAARTAHPDRLIPFVYALPSYEDPVLALVEEAITRRGFAGIKVHGGEATLEPWVLDPILGLAGRLDVPVLIDFVGLSAQAERVARTFPATTIIVAHMGKSKTVDDALLERFIRVAEAHANVYLDVSYMVTLWKIEEAVRRIGAQRTIFGTDGPHPTPDTVSYARIAIENVRSLDLTAGQQAEIFGGTIARLLGLAT